MGDRRGMGEREKRWEKKMGGRRSERKEKRTVMGEVKKESEK